jgi:hypothetical protein
VDSDGLEQKNNQLTFENEHCIISYDLWSEKGDMSFVLYNKTDKDMYIMMPQSFFIQNGMAYDYYTNAVSTSRQVSQVDRSATLGSAFAETSMTGGLWGAGKSATIGHSLTTENSTTTKEMAVVCIPPKAKKYFKGFNLVEAAHKDCDDYMLNYPKKVSDAITFGKALEPAFLDTVACYGSDSCSIGTSTLWQGKDNRHHKGRGDGCGTGYFKFNACR